MASSEQPDTKTYIVQVLHDTDGVWKDLGAYEVPAGTKRRAVLQQATYALQEYGLQVGDKRKVRVLDDESMFVHTAELEQRDPELRIR